MKNKTTSPKNKKNVFFDSESDSIDNSKFRISANPLPIKTDSESSKDIYNDDEKISERSEDDFSASEH